MKYDSYILLSATEFSAPEMLVLIQTDACENCGGLVLDTMDSTRQRLTKGLLESVQGLGRLTEWPAEISHDEDLGHSVCENC